MYKYIHILAAFKKLKDVIRIIISTNNIVEISAGLKANIETYKLISKLFQLKILRNTSSAVLYKVVFGERNILCLNNGSHFQNSE